MYVGDNSSYPTHYQRTIQTILLIRDEKSIEDVFFLPRLNFLYINQSSYKCKIYVHFFPINCFVEDIKKKQYWSCLL
jgi:hypothetical protein